MAGKALLDSKRGRGLIMMVLAGAILGVQQLFGVDVSTEFCAALSAGDDPGVATIVALVVGGGGYLLNLYGGVVADEPLNPMRLKK